MLGWSAARGKHRDDYAHGILLKGLSGKPFAGNWNLLSAEPRALMQDFSCLLCTIYSRYVGKDPGYKKSLGCVASSSTNLSHHGLSCKNLGCIQKSSSLSRGDTTQLSPVLFLQLIELSGPLSFACHPVQKHIESLKGNRSSQEQTLEIKLTLVQIYMQNSLDFSLWLLFVLDLPCVPWRVNVGWKYDICQENTCCRCQRLFCDALWYFHGIFGREAFLSVSFSCLKPRVTLSFKGW